MFIKLKDNKTLSGFSQTQQHILLLISNFRRVLNAIFCFFLGGGNFPAPELLVPTFRNFLSVPSS